MANVDGSNRQLMLIKSDNQIYIRAGCFFGSIDEFVERAKNENKWHYVNIVPAVANAMLQTEKEAEK